MSCSIFLDPYRIRVAARHLISRSLIWFLAPLRGSRRDRQLSFSIINLDLSSAASPYLPIPPSPEACGTFRAGTPFDLINKRSLV
ncbi:MAG: hypothetical protein QNJ54_37695 [Prochloraceae cyanobacterium]|nr:hypothetical protein [Prochloraceae cyanobacterium]